MALLIVPYMLLALNMVADSIFYGLGRTGYLAWQSIITNGTVYVAAFVAYIAGAWTPTFTSIMVLFGLGIVADSLLTLFFAWRVLWGEPKPLVDLLKLAKSVANNGGVHQALRGARGGTADYEAGVGGKRWVSGPLKPLLLRDPRRTGMSCLHSVSLPYAQELRHLPNAEWQYDSGSAGALYDLYPPCPGCD